MSTDDMFAAASKAIEQAVPDLASTSAPAYTEWLHALQLEAARQFGPGGYLSMETKQPFDLTSDTTTVVVTWTPACRCGHRPHRTMGCRGCECPWTYPEIPAEARPEGYTTIEEMREANNADRD